MREPGRNAVYSDTRETRIISGERLVSVGLRLRHGGSSRLNINRFFDPLPDQTRLMEEEGFLQTGHRDFLHVEKSPETLISLLTTHKA